MSFYNWAEKKGREWRIKGREKHIKLERKKGEEIERNVKLFLMTLEFLLRKFLQNMINDFFIVKFKCLFKSSLNIFKI